MSNKCSGYAGRIGNSGHAQVKAPFPSGGGKKGTVIKGGDLRTGSGGKKDK